MRASTLSRHSVLEREVRAPFPPAWMVRALMAPLAALAHRRGHAERYATV